MLWAITALTFLATFGDFGRAFLRLLVAGMQPSPSASRASRTPPLPGSTKPALPKSKKTTCPQHAGRTGQNRSRRNETTPLPAPNSC